MNLPMKIQALLLLIPFLVGTVCTAGSPKPLQIPVRDLSGKEVRLGDFGAKAILIVNVASECGYTSQYAGLEELYRSLKNKGLLVIGVPCNDFGGQEPGSNEEIRKFCSSRYQVTFPLLEKTAITGENGHPLYKILTSKESGIPGPVSWNFNKFLLSRDGRVAARFDSSVEPDAAELLKAVAGLLAP